MRECLEAYQAATERADRLFTAAKLKWEFIGEHYPMQLIVEADNDYNQVQIEGMQEPQSQMRIVYKFMSGNISWHVVNDVEITNDLNNKIVSAFKGLCNAYAHYRFSEFLEGYGWQEELE